MNTRLAPLDTTRRVKVPGTVLTWMLRGCPLAGPRPSQDAVFETQSALIGIPVDAELLAVEDVGRGEAAFWLVYAHPSFLVADQSAQETTL